ncbi:Fic family protein [Sulfurimonas sp.]|jgi:Fic family protein|uniref:Fic family protein n=1 Tax=Sulfurimonas sp. TaxID=2022749 RepID=UPI002A36263D|nr:Fic family protein [Sulfurimonas sp.]MDY0123773.1 Fic family protein [Sulfurimonas sp.]
MKTDQSAASLENKLKWIWQSDNFPNFIYDNVNLESLTYKFGQLKMVENFMNQSDSNELLLEVLLDEAIATSAIEGEILQRSSVRSSINKLLKLGLEDDYSYTAQSDNLIEILIDAKTNKEPLTKKRLSAWHKALFPTGSSGLRDIAIGTYRTNSDDMQIVSGPWEREKIHFVAPPSKIVEKLMDDFLEWLNKRDEQNSIYKAIVAHLYFVLIHPFDDGNGRIARAITDYVLAQTNLANANFYSISTIIYKNRKEYYEVLDNVCKQTDQDITIWMQWFVKLLEISIDETLQKVEVVQTKAKFWDKHRDTQLNDRQKKVILKMLSYLPEKFEGGMRVNKYMSLTKSQRLTASRDIADLVQKGIFESFGKGRGVYYELKI